MDKWIIIYGSIGQGFSFCGPFNTSDEAIEYAEENMTPGYWEVSVLEGPDDDLMPSYIGDSET